MGGRHEAVRSLFRMGGTLETLPGMPAPHVPGLLAPVRSALPRMCTGVPTFQETTFGDSEAVRPEGNWKDGQTCKPQALKEGVLTNETKATDPIGVVVREDRLHKKTA